MRLLSLHIHMEMEGKADIMWLGYSRFNLETEYASQFYLFGDTEK